jgi:hypothetical protein
MEGPKNNRCQCGNVRLLPNGFAGRFRRSFDGTIHGVAPAPSPRTPATPSTRAARDLIAAYSTASPETKMEVIMNTVKAFLETYIQEHQDEISTEGPQLECFEPKEDALLGSLWKPKNVPARQSLGEQAEGSITTKRPSLLLHGLNDTNSQWSQPAAHDHIRIAQQQGPTFLYGTSGAGKTRSVFEYLSRNKGFYFLADDFERNPGSRDLLMVLDCDLPTVHPKDTRTNTENRTRIKRRVSMLLFVRYAVHEKLTALLKRDMTPYEWLLYQLFPKQLLGGDIFSQAIVECDIKNVEGTIRFPTKEVWSIFVDEAQALLKMNELNFLSENGSNVRAALSALVEGPFNHWVHLNVKYII